MVNYLQIPSASLRVTGPDANRFLQGQFTQNLRLILGGKAYGLWLNQKGRALADSYVLRVTEDEHRIFSFSPAGPGIKQRLEDYLIADEVVVDDVSEAWTGIAILGPNAEEIAKTLDVPLPDGDTFGVIDGAFIFRSRFSARPNFALMIPNDALAGFRTRFNGVGMVEATPDDLVRERIASGIPAVPDDIGLGDLPNEGGLDEAAISYTKGCYLGQEVMARLKNLGQVRRKLHRIRGKGAPPAAPTAVMQGEKKIGDTRTAVRDGEGFVAMAMLSLINFSKTVPAQLSDGRAVSVEEIVRG